MIGPQGFWCRGCGAYQSTRTQAQATKARAHTAAHEAAGEQPLDGKPWRKTSSMLDKETP